MLRILATITAAAVGLCASSPPVAAQGTQDLADKALTAFAANLRGAKQFKFRVTLSARAAQNMNLAPLVTMTYDVKVTRPDQVEFTPVSGTNVRLVSDGTTLRLEDGEDKVLLETSAPSNISGIAALLPKTLPPGESSVFQTITTLLGPDPAGFIAGEALDRGKIANMMVDGQAGDLFQFVEKDRKTMAGFSANAKPLLLSLAVDAKIDEKTGLVLNYTFKNWDMRGTRRADSSGALVVEAADGGTTKPAAAKPGAVRRGGLVIEDAPKPVRR